MFEMGGFLAGVISEAELGAQSIVYELAVIAYMVNPPHDNDDVLNMNILLKCFHFPAI